MARRSPENTHNNTGSNLLSTEEKSVIEKNICKSKKRIKKINLKIEQIVSEAMSGIQYIVNSNGVTNGVSFQRNLTPTNKHKHGDC